MIYSPTLLITIVDNPALIQKSKEITNNGIVVHKDLYSYLKIKDEFVHELFNLLKVDNAKKPYYFSTSKNFIGAHITIFYNEENIAVEQKDLGQQHSFTIKNLSQVILGSKKYYALMVTSSTLENLRKSYGLSTKPCYKGFIIDFHITLAFQDL